MGKRVEAWRDYGGTISFTYGHERWTVEEEPGLGMKLDNDELYLCVRLGTYPTPEFVERILHDFAQCCPGVTRGSYRWAQGAWHKA